MFYVTGDIHGAAYELFERLRNMDLKEGDVIMCVGDVGLKYGSHVAGQLRALMSAQPATFLVMRGNHDARYVRDWWAGRYLGTKYLREKDWCGMRVVFDERDPNILYLPDEGGAFERNGRRCLVVPGAFSVDGDYRRRNGRPFEPEEQLTCEELANLAALAAEAPVDYVFSHTCPRAWEDDVSYLFLDFLDQSGIDKRMEDALDGILETVRPSLRCWFFGHFHDDNDIIAGGLGHMVWFGTEAVPELA